MALLDSSMFPARVSEYYAEQKENFVPNGPEYRELEEDEKAILDRLATGEKFPQMFLDSALHHKIRGFTEWLFCEGGEVEFDGILWPYRVNDYSVTFLPNDEATMEQFGEMVKSLKDEWPLAWDDAVDGEVYYNVPLYGAVERIMGDSATILRKAGYVVVADAIQFARFDREPDPEELVAANILGVMLAGMPVEHITDFQAQGHASGMLPIWTQMRNVGISEEQMVEIYNRALARLLEAQRVH